MHVCVCVCLCACVCMYVRTPIDTIMETPLWYFGKYRTKLFNRVGSYINTVDTSVPIKDVPYFPDGKRGKTPCNKLCSWPIIFLKQGLLLGGDCGMAPLYTATFLCLYVLCGKCVVYASQMDPKEEPYTKRTWAPVRTVVRDDHDNDDDNNDGNNDDDDDNEAFDYFRLSSDVPKYVLIPPKSKFFIQVISPSCVIWSEGYSDRPCKSNIDEFKLPTRMVWPTHGPKEVSPLAEETVYLLQQTTPGRKEGSSSVSDASVPTINKEMKKRSSSLSITVSSRNKQQRQHTQRNTESDAPIERTAARCAVSNNSNPNDNVTISNSSDYDNGCYYDHDIVLANEVKRFASALETIVTLHEFDKNVVQEEFCRFLQIQCPVGKTEETHAERGIYAEQSQSAAADQSATVGDQMPMTHALKPPNSSSFLKNYGFPIKNNWKSSDTVENNVDSRLEELINSSNMDGLKESSSFNSDDDQSVSDVPHIFPERESE